VSGDGGSGPGWPYGGPPPSLAPWAWPASLPGGWPYGGPQAGPADRAAPPPTPKAPTPPRRRRRALATVAAAVVLALGATAAVAAGRPDRAAPSTSATPTPAGSAQADRQRLRDLGALLERRGEAVVAGDEAAFLADLDLTDPAFVARQRALFRSLLALPDARPGWALRSGAEVNRPTFQARYGVPISIVRAVFTYQLAGYDSARAASEQGLTFTDRGGRWWLASDGDIDNLLPPGGHTLPWDVGPIEVVTGKRSLIVGTPQDKPKLPALAAQVDAAVSAVAKLWPSGWPQKVVVFAPRDPKAIATYFRSELQDVNSAAAVAVPVPSLSGTVAGQRVIFNPTLVRPGDKDLPALLRHEIAHVATDSFTGGGAARWLVEGIAEYTAYRADFTDRLLPTSVFARAGKGRLVAYLPTSSDFYQDGDNYDVSWLICLYVKQRYGERKLVSLYRTATDTDDVTAGGDVAAAAIAKVLGVSETRFIRDVNAWAKRVVRPA